MLRTWQQLPRKGKTTSWFSRICTNSLNEEQPRKAVYKTASYLAAELRWKFDFLTSLRINTETPQLDVLSISVELLFWSFWFTRVLGKKTPKHIKNFKTQCYRRIDLSLICSPLHQLSEALLLSFDFHSYQAVNGLFYGLLESTQTVWGALWQV